MSKEFEFPEIREVKLVPDNHADEFIKIPVVRYEELLDAETRLEAIMNIIKDDFENAKYPTELGRAVLLIAGYTSYFEEREERKKEQ